MMVPVLLERMYNMNPQNISMVKDILKQRRKIKECLLWKDLIRTYSMFAFLE